jgi:integrase/recombinase XerC
MPKIHDKAITRLDVNEVAELLDNVESGNKLTDNQLKRHEKLKCRDLALLTLMLGTGIRVSECVGLDINDIDFDNDRIKVVRKGGSESFVYFGDEARSALLDYMEERKNLNPEDGHENALFISSKNKRLCVRSVELLVKKYASTVTTVKHITPHKLRSTYGTNLYQASKDIYLVADVLGHKDVNTTRKHYAEIVDENKRSARNIVRLRTEE